MERLPAVPRQEQQTKTCILRDTGNKMGSKGMTEHDVRWETNQSLHKERSRARKVIIKLFTRTTYRYNGKNSLCLRVPKKYIQERDDLYGLAQAHAMC